MLFRSDDLIRFPKGTKRINRLRVLAYDGLLAQGGQLLANNLASMLRTPTSDADEGRGAVTNGLFEPSHLE